MDNFVSRNLASTDDPDRLIPALLSNGRVALRILPDGTGGGAHAWKDLEKGSPTVTDTDFESLYAIDQRDPKTDKFISLPNPLAMTIGGGKLKLDGFKQTMDLETGVLTTSYTSSFGPIQVKSWVDPKAARGRDEWFFNSDKNLPLQFPLAGVKTFLSGPSTKMEFSDGTPPTVLLAVRLVELDLTQFAVVDKAAGVWKVSVPPGPWHLVREFELPGKTVTSASVQTPVQTFEGGPNIVIEGPARDQQSVSSFLYYLRSSIAPGTTYGPTPFGLGSITYDCRTFWDADTWLFPALALLDPERAKVIPDFRLRTAGQAGKNGAEWARAHYKFERPMGGALPLITKYPWQSDSGGSERATGKFQDEEHITGDVVWCLNLAASLGLADVGQVDSVARSAAAYYQLRSDGMYYHLKSGREGDQRIMSHVLSPDEYQTVDNDLYTNLLARWVTNGRKWGADSYYLPRDSKTLLNYDGDQEKVYKQPAALLAIYPLQFPEAVAQGEAMYQRFASKTTENGPNMAHALHALISARLGNPDRGYKDWVKASREYTWGLMLQGEKKVFPTGTYFTTGGAICLQAVLYGFCGIVIDTAPQPGALWKMPLKNGAWISIKPHLPTAWKSVKLEKVKLLGKSYTITVTPTTVKVDLGV